MKPYSFRHHPGFARQVRCPPQGRSCGDTIRISAPPGVRAKMKRAPQGSESQGRGAPRCGRRPLTFRPLRTGWSGQLFKAECALKGLPESIGRAPSEGAGASHWGGQFLGVFWGCLLIEVGVWGNPSPYSDKNFLDCGRAVTRLSPFHVQNPRKDGECR